MPVLVFIDPNNANKQGYVIQDATPSNDGVMTAAQAAKLAGINPGGGSATAYANFAAFPSAAANPGAFAIDSSSPGAGQGTLYCAFGGVWCAIAILSP